MEHKASTDDPLAQAIKNGRLYVYVASLLTLLTGILLVLEPFLRHSRHHFTGYFLPSSVVSFADFTMLFLGLIFIYLAWELAQRKHSAWLITLGAAIVSLGVEFQFDEPLVRSIFTIALLIVLLVGYKQFVVKSHATNLRQGVIALVASLFFAVAYGTVGFWLLDKRDFGINFTWDDSFNYTIKQYLLLGNTNLTPHNRFSHFFLYSLTIVGVTAIAYAIYSILRPLQYEFRTLPHEREHARHLLETYGGGTDDYFKLWPEDKSYFFSTDGEAFVAYAVSRGVAVVFADPEGKPESIKLLMHEFRSYCLGNGWLVAFIAASDKHKKLFEHNGYSSLVIGADAIIDIPHFLSETARNKYFRNITNRFEKSGETAERYLPPHDPELIADLKQVSDDWLKIPGHKQWQFITGYFSSRYFEETPLFVVRDENGWIDAFANEIPCYRKGESTVDLMRHKRAAPKNVMDFLFIKLMQQLHEEGYDKFNLGLSPLARQTFSGSSEKLLDYIYLASQRFISTKGLHQYKSKFEPTWEPRYVYYIGSASSLTLIGLSLSNLSTYKQKK